MEQQSIIAIIGAIGLVLLALSWHFRNSNNPLLAQIGWILVSLYFFAGSWKYFTHQDYILTTMCMLALPLGIGMSIWEGRVEVGKTKDALIWSRGAMAYAGGPYLLIAHVPWLSVLAIWFVASQVALFYRMSGTGDIHLGETFVQTESGPIEWGEWGGNRWFSTETFGEFPYQTELIAGDGTAIGINFVLACTALQSMVIFIGAISVLELDWRRRIRALIFTVPVIHILNIFRNVEPILSDVVFEKKDRFHIYSIAKQLIDNGWNPDHLYTFIYVSEGGAGLRLNTIQINYLKSLASFIK